MDRLKVSILGEERPYGSIGEFWGQVGQSKASRSHPSNHELNRGDFARGMLINSFSIRGIQDAYKMKVSVFDENLTTCPINLNHENRTFGYLQLRVNPLVYVKGSQLRAGRIEAAKPKYSDLHSLHGLM